MTTSEVCAETHLGSACSFWSFGMHHPGHVCVEDHYMRVSDDDLK